jgi:hypothetical protein
MTSCSLISGLSHSQCVVHVFLNIHYPPIVSRDSAVGIATGCGLEDREDGVRIPVGSRIFSSPRRPDRLWGTGGSFPGSKAAGA